MHPLFWRRRCVAVVLALALAVAGAACGDDADEPSSSAAATRRSDPAGATFVGVVEGTDAFIGIQDTDRGPIVYLCDGAKVWEHLEATIAGDGLTATSPNGTLSARKDASGWSGTVQLPDGTDHRFTAAAAVGQAGVFWQASVEGARSALGGWIRLADGRVRGKQTITVAEQESASTEVVPDGASAGSGGGATVPPAAAGSGRGGVLACALAYIRFAKASKAMREDPSRENTILRDAAAIEVQQAC